MISDDKYSGKGKVESQREPAEHYLDGLGQSVKLSRTTGSETIQNILRPLFQTFKDLGVRTNYFSNAWWLDLVRGATLFDDEGKILQAQLLNQAEQIEADNIDVRDFLHIYALTTRIGLLQLGGVLRAKAREAALLSIDKAMDENFSLFAYGIGALHELGRFDEAKQYVEYSNITNSRYLNKERHLRNIIGDNPINPNELYDIELNIDKEFKTYIQGKTIAVVGPADTLEEDAENIDSFDIVVRCNYKERGVGVDARKKGLRCDVSYYNRWQSEFIIQNPVKNWPTEIKWIVHRRKDFSDEVHQKLKENIPNYVFKSRVHNYMDYILFNGHLNAIPNILLDLLCFHPKRIKVFHSDLMLTMNRDRGYQVPFFEDTKEKYNRVLWSFTNVEPLTQLLLLKNLFYNKKIEGDKRFVSVMELDERSYMKELQDVYGNGGRLL